MVAKLAISIILETIANHRAKKNEQKMADTSWHFWDSGLPKKKQKKAHVSQHKKYICWNEMLKMCTLRVARCFLCLGTFCTFVGYFAPSLEVLWELFHFRWALQAAKQAWKNARIFIYNSEIWIKVWAEKRKRKSLTGDSCSTLLYLHFCRSIAKLFMIVRSPDMKWIERVHAN